MPESPPSGLGSGPLAVRRTSPRNFVGLHLALGILAAGAWTAGIFGLLPLALPVVLALGAAPLLVGIVYTLLVTRSTKYRLHREALEIERGILSRRIENLQIFRVRDIGLAQSLLGRILKVGDVTITSTDRSSPRLVVRGIDDPRGFYETLRALVAESQAARRTMIVEEESPRG
jgi:uncharacterized membrane protein YdbT with pleckstrin-like domain